MFFDISAQITNIVFVQQEEIHLEKVRYLPTLNKNKGNLRKIELVMYARVYILCVIQLLYFFLVIYKE